jgi:hypothetical protein
MLPVEEKSKPSWTYFPFLLRALLFFIPPSSFVVIPISMPRDIQKDCKRDEAGKQYRGTGDKTGDG